MRQLGIALMIFFVVVALSSIPRSYARDPDGRYAGSPNKAWFDSLRSGKGPCCADYDGHILADVDWESRDGHYRVRIEGQWIDVPDDAVLNQPNKDGRTIVWPYYENWDAKHTIKVRCLIIGAQG
jgi:hypothetical protein